MKEGKWNLQTAEPFLRRNKVFIDKRKIVKPRGGIAIWGAIDFLVNHCGYEVER